MSSNNYEVEESLLKGALWKLPPETIERLLSCRSSHRFMAYERKVLVIYELIGDRPKVHNRLTCESASLNLTSGLTSAWHSAADDKKVIIGHLPVEVAPTIFLWHTYNSAIHYAPYKGIYTAKFSCVYKTLNNPNVTKANCLYMQELASYQASYQKGAA